MTTSTEYAENVCLSLSLPIRGVAFIYIENAISAALDLQAEKFNARIAALEQLNRDLTAAAVTDPISREWNTPEEDAAWKDLAADGAVSA